MMLISAEIKSDFSDVNSELNDVTVNSNEGNGYRASLGYSRQFSDVAMNIGFFYEFWWVKESNYEFLKRNGELISAGGGLYRAVYEPTNETHISGVDLSVLF